MSDAPTFLLPGCPACSHAPRLCSYGKSAGVVERPNWQFAHRTSASRGAKSYLWSGCKHAAAVAVEATKTPLSSGFGEVEEKWRAALPSLLAERTAKWSDASRAELARFLEDRPFEISPSGPSEAPATHEQRTTKEEQ